MTSVSGGDISRLVSSFANQASEDYKTVNLYERPNTLYALKLSLIVMEAQNKRVLLKIILHCHGQLVCFVLVSVHFYIGYTQNILGDNFFRGKKSQS